MRGVRVSNPGAYDLGSAKIRVAPRVLQLPQLKLEFHHCRCDRGRDAGDVVINLNLFDHDVRDRHELGEATGSYGDLLAVENDVAAAGNAHDSSSSVGGRGDGPRGVGTFQPTEGDSHASGPLSASSGPEIPADLGEEIALVWDRVLADTAHLDEAPGRAALVAAQVADEVARLTLAWAAKTAEGGDLR